MLFRERTTSFSFTIYRIVELSVVEKNCLSSPTVRETKGRFGILGSTELEQPMKSVINIKEQMRVNFFVYFITSPNKIQLTTSLFVRLPRFLFSGTPDYSEDCLWHLSASISRSSFADSLRSSFASLSHRFLAGLSRIPFVN